jgi:hypothetical protein
MRRPPIPIFGCNSPTSSVTLASAGGVSVQPPSHLILHRHRCGPRFPSSGGFQTPAGPNKASAYPCGRHLKPITRADMELFTESARSWGISRCTCSAPAPATRNALFAFSPLLF